MEPFTEMIVSELGQMSEPVFISAHACNQNLKEGVTKKHPRSGYDTLIKTQLEMINYHTETKKSLEKMNKEKPELEEQKIKREKKNAENIKVLKDRVEWKRYRNSVGKQDGFNNKKAYETKREREEYNFALAFGLGFISLTFLGFLTGFCFGMYVM